jgi:hypothetical protein
MDLLSDIDTSQRTAKNNHRNTLHTQLPTIMYITPPQIDILTPYIHNGKPLQKAIKHEG